MWSSKGVCLVWAGIVGGAFRSGCDSFNKKGVAFMGDGCGFMEHGRNRGEELSSV